MKYNKDSNKKITFGGSTLKSLPDENNIIHSFMH